MQGKWMNQVSATCVSSNKIEYCVKWAQQIIDPYIDFEPLSQVFWDLHLRGAGFLYSQSFVLINSLLTKMVSLS